MAQKFLTYKQQIDKLIYDRGLVIENRKYAEVVLKQIGYFALVSTYKDLFADPNTKRYRSGTKLEDIVALYKFDENLRELFLKYLLKIERNLRSLISHYFTEKYGEKQSAYLNPDNFTDDSERRGDVMYLIHSLERLANEKGDYPEIDYYRDTFRNVPLWVLVNGMTFGTLSKCFQLMTQDLQERVGREFPEITGDELEEILKVMTKFRNICAHNERLFSYKSKHEIPDFPAHKKLYITKKGNKYVCGKNDLFALFVAFRYMLTKEDFLKFKNRFSDTLAHYLNNTTAIGQDEILEAMGFPINWEDIS